MIASYTCTCSCTDDGSIETHETRFETPYSIPVQRVYNKSISEPFDDRDPLRAWPELAVVQKPSMRKHPIQVPGMFVLVALALNTAEVPK